MPDQLTPTEFAARIKAKYPAYANMSDVELVSKVTSKYPQYQSMLVAPPAPAPKLPAGAGGESPISSAHAQDAAIMEQTQKQYPNVTSPKTIGTALGATVGGAAVPEAGVLLKALSEGAGAGVGHAAGSMAQSGSPDVKGSLIAGAGTAALGGAMGAAGKLMTKVEPLARLNKILGVGPKEVRVGTTPESLDEFASNPARGVLKVGLKEKELAKMNPLERVQKLTEVRNQAGEKLDQVLQSASDKTINVQKTVEDVFKQIPDRRLQSLATKRMQMILQKNNITKPLSQLTPMEARIVQRGLDDFANFAPEGTAKSFADIATALRRGISKATRQAIPETAELDQDYGDLAGAVKSVRRQANKYARTVPEGKLRKMAPYIASGALGGLGYAGVKHLLPSQTP